MLMMTYFLNTENKLLFSYKRKTKMYPGTKLEWKFPPKKQTFMSRTCQKYEISGLWDLVSLRRAVKGISFIALHFIFPIF